MPREMIIASWCDACFLDGGKKEPSVHTYTIGIATGEARPTPHVVEACEQHVKAIEDLMALAGQTEILKASIITKPVAPVSKKERAETGNWATPRQPCAICRVDLSYSGYIGHIYSQHAMKARPIPPKTCPVCGETYSNASSCARHRIDRHGYDPIDEALSQVKGYEAAK